MKSPAIVRGFFLPAVIEATFGRDRFARGRTVFSLTGKSLIWHKIPPNAEVANPGLHVSDDGPIRRFQASADA